MNFEAFHSLCNRFDAENISPDPMNYVFHPSHFATFSENQELWSLPLSEGHSTPRFEAVLNDNKGDAIGRIRMQFEFPTKHPLLEKGETDVRRAKNIWMEIWDATDRTGLDIHLDTVKSELGIEVKKTDNSPEDIRRSIRQDANVGVKTVGSLKIGENGQTIDSNGELDELKTHNLYDIRSGLIRLLQTLGSKTRDMIMEKHSEYFKMVLLAGASS